MHTDDNDKTTLVLLGRRFAWMTLALFVALLAGFWIAHAIVPDRIGAVTEYTLTTSLIGAVTFGGLYAAAMALRPSKAKDRAPASGP